MNVERAMDRPDASDIADPSVNMFCVQKITWEGRNWNRKRAKKETRDQGAVADGRRLDTF